MSTFFVGAYSPDMGGTADGIAVLVSRDDGTLAFERMLAPSLSPVYLKRDGATLYAVGEASNLIEAFDLPSGRLVAADVAGGTAPCHITLHDGRALVSCYGDGTVSTFATDPVRLFASIGATGNGPNAEQLNARAHSTLVVGDQVLSADFGSDTLHVHAWVDRQLVRERSVSLPPGSGPRDLVLHPDGFVLVLTQLSNEVIVLSPEFEPVSRTRLPGAVDGDYAATLSLSGDARFAFAGIRGSDLIASLALEGASITAIAAVDSAGRFPRHNVVDGDILHVANQRSDSVASFAIDRGVLTLIGEPTSVASPTHLERA